MALTKSDDDDGRGKAGYLEFVRRAAKNPLARRVKPADIEHNMDLTRMSTIRDKDLERLARYHEARAILLAVTD